MANLDWASLPKELLGLIAERIVHIEDFIIFGLVCKPWQSATILEEKPASPPKFPWLMLAEDQKHPIEEDADNKKIKDKTMKDTQPRCFFNIFSSKVFEFDLPEASGRKCLATNFGWLFTIGIDLEVKLLHPFSRHQINLPPRSTFTSQYVDVKFNVVLCIYVRKAILSCPPPSKKSKDQTNCVIMTIYGEYSVLAFARLGDKAWTDIRVPSRSYDDIVYYRDRFYAVDCHGVVVVCDIDDGDPRATVITPAPAETRDTIQKYLVEASGDLLLVSRIRRGLLYDAEGVHASEECLQDETKRFYTVGFSILKMEMVEDEKGANEYPYHWVEVKSLGNRALFLGNNSSVSLSASSSSKNEEDNNITSNYSITNNGCLFIKPNCVYFTDDNVEMFSRTSGGGYDMGIFNMEDGTIQRHYTGPSRSFYCTPLWYI